MEKYFEFLPYIFIAVIIIQIIAGILATRIVIKSLQDEDTAQQSFALDGVHAERTLSVSCPHCNRQIEVVLLVSPRR